MITPLPAGSRLLRERRYQASVHGPKNERGARPQLAEGRFVKAESAKAWADEQYPQADYVSVTFYSARSGWRAQSAAARKNGVWS